jgi:hypothetical protein
MFWRMAQSAKLVHHRVCPGGNPADQIEDTCHERSARTYKKGLRTPGAATVTLPRIRRTSVT